MLGAAREPVRDTVLANPRVVRALQEGLDYHRKGRLREAIAAYGRCLAIDPSNASALQFAAAAEVALGQTAAAVEHARRAAALAPRDTGLIENVASVLLMAGDIAGAVALCDRTLVSQPRNIRLLYARAVGHFKLKQYRLALTDFDAVVVLDPRHADALSERGACLAQLGEYEAAVASIERALKLTPDKADAHFNLGYLLSILRRPAEARAPLERAFHLRPRYTEAVTLWAGGMAALKRQEEGLATCKAMIERDPSFEGGYGGVATLLNSLGARDEAIGFADQAVALAPDKISLHRIRGEILQELRRWSEAVSAYEQAYRLDPTQSELTGGLLYAKLQAVDWRGIDGLINECLHNPASSGSFEALGFCDDLGTLLATAQIRTQKYSRLDSKVFDPAVHSSKKRLTIAYISSDFREHPVSYLIAGMLEAHDRSRFEVIGVALRANDESAIGARVHTAFDSIIEAHSMPDDEVVDAVRAHEVDIAVDLMGYTSDMRLEPFARRLAPVQATWLGYAGTVGTPGIDYLIADPTVVPQEHFKYYVENIVQLPDTYMPTDNKQRIAEATVTRTQAGLPEAGFVFSCFNQLFKILPETFDSWMRILSRTPGSVLWLSRGAPDAVANLRREAQMRGVDPERLIFAPFVPTHADHLARLRCADLGLDTLPYNAHTTAVDSLWVGRPMLTLVGKAFAGRVAASLLHAVGLPELVTTSTSDYEDAAVRLATDSIQLATIRERLENNRRTQPLFDTGHFTRNMETAFEMMWRRFREGLPPAPFAVAANHADS